MIFQTIAPPIGPALTVGGTDYTWDDVIAAARQRGEWQAVERDAREGVACLRFGDGAGTPLDPQQVRAAAAAFRRQRQLLAAEEMEAWLGRWGISLAEWMGYIRRSLARKAFIDTIEPSALQAVDDADVEPLVWPTAVSSGALGTHAHRLAARLAVVAAQGEDFRRSAAELEATYQRFCDAASSPDRLLAQISLMQLEWTCVSYRSLAFDREPQAQEATLMVRDDGAALDEVAVAVNKVVHSECVYLGDVDEDLRYRLLGAAPGEVLGPVDSAGRWSVIVVEDKVGPSLDDEDLAVRARAAAVAAAVQSEVNDRVTMTWR